MKFLLSIIITLVFISFSLLSSAQSYAVKPINDYLPEYKEKHRIILADLEKRTDLAHAQKYVLYQHDLNNLKEEFKAIRRAEYESKEIALSVQNTCTGESNGQVKDCGSKCISAPSGDLYTQNDWIKVEENIKGASISSTDSTACIRMAVVGKRRSTGTLLATFKYRPASVIALSDKDTDALFLQVGLLKPEYLK